MTSVLTAFRSNEEKVAAAIAECRRMGIEVLPPDVHSSGVEFTVEGQAIRFGLLAVKNVGQGAIESIIAARAEGGAFRSLRDFCERVDLRLVNSRVIEALAWVGALSEFGHTFQILDALPTILPLGPGGPAAAGDGPAVGLRHAVRRGAGREPPGADGGPPTGAAAQGEGAPRHLPLGAPDGRGRRAGRRVRERPTAATFKDESLDGQRIVIAGIVTGFRTVITKAKSTMGVATLEDLQGTIEVVVFPKLYEQTAGDLARGLDPARAGPIDHRGEEVSLLADLVDGLGRRPRPRPGGVRPRGRGRRSRPAAAPPGTGPVGPGPNGDGTATRTATAMEPRMSAIATARRGQSPAVPEPVAVGPGVRPEIPYVSPLRAEAREREPAASLPSVGPGGADPNLPGAPALERPRRIETLSRPCPTRPGSGRPASPRRTPQVEASPERRSSTCGSGGAGTDRVVGAMETFKGLLAERPGATRVVLHVPAPTGATSLPMELRRGVAYDAELLAEVRRRLGDGIVEVSLG